MQQHHNHNIYISTPTHYIPELILNNTSLANITGKPEEWFEKRTGIIERRRVGSNESQVDMAIKCVEKMSDKLKGVDLIITSSYTPQDLLGSLGHRIQAHFDIQNARVYNVNTGCCSTLNAMEMAVSFLKSGVSKKILLVSAEVNSTYSTDTDLQGGHLWGDGSASFVMHNGTANGDHQVLDIFTSGLGHLGKGPEGVTLQTKVGIRMNFGRDVFQHACIEMIKSCYKIMDRNQLKTEDIQYVIPHQANQRIIDRLSDDLGINKSRVISDIRKLGNTGSASIPISWSLNQGLFSKDKLLLITAFGGGYSTGAALIRV